MKTNIQISIETADEAAFGLLVNQPVEWMKEHPQKAAALLENIGYLEEELRDGLHEYLKETGKTHIDFKSRDGSMMTFGWSEPPITRLTKEANDEQ